MTCGELATGSTVEASVIIPVFNGAAHIGEQLRALAAQQTDVSWELIVADNGSTDETLSIVERNAPQINVPVRIIDASHARGTAAARNAGAGAALGELLLFTDQDDVADERWVQELVWALRSHPFVGGRRELSALNGDEVASWRAHTAVESLPLWCGQPYVVGCNLGCTATAYAAVGGFDEAFTGGGEDVDLSLRMRARGITAAFAEGAVVHYRYRQEPMQAVRQLWGYGRACGRLYALHGFACPTGVDLMVSCYRHVKQAARSTLRGRSPVRQAMDIAYLIGEGSVLGRDPAFWRPATVRERIANPLTVWRRRTGRLRGRCARKA